MQHVVSWLSASTVGVPRWTLALLAAMSVAEWVLGRSRDPRLRSVAAVFATLLHFLVVRSGLARIKLAGPVIVYVLESISGKDLDDDGKIAFAPDPSAGADGGGRNPDPEAPGSVPRGRIP